MLPSLGPDKIGLIGAFLAIALAFLLDPYTDGASPRAARLAPAPTEPAKQPAPLAKARSETKPPTMAKARPEPKPPEQPARRPLPEPSRLDPVFGIDFRPKTRSGSATGFAVGRGVWLTARHVTHGCHRLAFDGNANGLFQLPGDSVEHPDADVAIVVTRVDETPSLEFGPVPSVGDIGVTYGYAAVGKGTVTGQLIGRTRITGTPLRGIGELGLIWAEIKRDGPKPGRLGGMSGGPTLDDQGRIVGVHISSNPRRGRTVTVAPRAIRDLLDGNPSIAVGGARPPWSAPPPFSDLEAAGVVRRLTCVVW